MCGIFGFATKKSDAFSSDQLHQMTDDLFTLSDSRGKEAAGVLIETNSAIHSYKEPIGARSFIRKPMYMSLFHKIEPHPSPIVIVGHARLATNGLHTENKNNQPVNTGNTMGVHNGIVVNDAELWKKIGKKPKFEVDTEAVFELMNHYLRQGHTHEAATAYTYRDIEGSASLAMLFRDRPVLLISTNTGSLYLLRIREPDSLVFASEEFIIRTWLTRNRSLFTDETMGHIQHLLPGSGVMLDIPKFRARRFSLDTVSKRSEGAKKRFWLDVRDYSDDGAAADATSLKLYRNLNSVKSLSKHNFDYRAIYAIHRCTKCILPVTTPFITFDVNGVCNYCQEHTKISYKGKPALERLVAPFRSKNGKHDSIIAFSGGRDSSYGLHFLKKELGLNPIAYTYDWGMVTDIARRNEARMVGKLGVEHVIVSADITMKRDHIRKHILAWMKKPDLGMVPLFMEGDKQCEFYADRLARQNNIRLVFFCRGNELEKEEFKAGHCGINNADPGGVIHNLAFAGKVKMAAYYAKQYITNPAYINSSVFDTAFAYFSTYIQRHDYIFLWHYIRWDEKTILDTLIKQYRWEVSPETAQRWRTDDGSSAFYNYIYYTGQGFTENDSFRSRQIREGLLTRKQALMLVNEENKPRYQALAWYFDRVGLNGDEVLEVVDHMPRLY